MPLETWMPRFDARSSHALEIAADPAHVYHALLSIDFSRNPVVRVLMAIRTAPAMLLAPRRTWARWKTARAVRLGQPAGDMLAGAFTQLEAVPPVELVLGLTGRFWTPSGGLIPSDVATFRDPVPAGLARAAWNFRVEPARGGGSRLSTETRVLCADAATRRSFLRYWRIISPGSGLIRWALLRQVKSVAENSVPE